jgi:hypothetical protein
VRFLTIRIGLAGPTRGTYLAKKIGESKPRSTPRGAATVAVTLRLPAELIEKVDLLRSNLQPSPSRAEAIRQLLRVPFDEVLDNPVKPGPTTVSGQLGPVVVKKHHMPAYPRAILIGLDVLCNAVLAGRPYQTLSCRVGESIMDNGWAAHVPWSRAWINHCLASVHEAIV